MPRRRPLIAIVGDTRMKEGGRKWNLAVALSQRLIDESYRIVTGGLGDLPAAVARGARSSAKYREGDLVAILPGFDPAEASGHADIVIATGLDYARNLIVANSDAVVAIGGGAGTLSEIALAWSLKRLVLAYRVPGWSGRLAGKVVDDRPRASGTKARVLPVQDERVVSELLRRLLPQYAKRHRGARVVARKPPEVRRTEMSQRLGGV